MTVETTSNKSGPYVLDGRVEFPRHFMLLDEKHMQVIHSLNGADSIIYGGYTQTGIGESEGSVIFDIPSSLPSEGQVTLYRYIEPRQETDYSNQARVQPVQVEADLDKLMMLVQQANEVLGRAIVVSKGSTHSIDPIELDGSEEFGNKVLQFNADATRIIAGPDSFDVDETIASINEFIALAKDLEIALKSSVPTIESRSEVEQINIPLTVLSFLTLGYYSAGDGGGAEYKRVDAEPSHSGKVQSLDGAWWEIVDLKDVRQAGGNGKGIDYDDAAVAVMREKLGYIKSEGGVIAMQNAITGEWAAVLEKTGLGGDHPLNEKFPAFGTGALWVATNRFNNGIIGITYNDSPIGTPAFPAGVTGYGRNDNTGNSVFGLFGRADQYASAGTVTNEVNSFNWSSTPASSSLPPILGPASPEQHPVALIVAAGGINDSSIGIFIGNEGESPQTFKTGIYIHPNAATQYGIYVDSDLSIDRPGIMARHSSTGKAISIQAKTTYNPNYSVFNILDSSNFERFGIKQSGVMYFGGGENNQSTVGVAGSAATLPVAPSGYLKIQVNGSDKVIPYYES